MGIFLLTVDGHFSAGHLLVGLQQQAAAAAGGVIDAVVLLRLHQLGDKFGDLAGGKELPALFARVRGKHGNHIFIGIPNDVGGIQLAGPQIQVVEVLQQVAEGGVFLLRFSKVHLGVEIDSTEHIAQLAAVALFDMVQRYIDLLADLRVIPVVIQVVEGGVCVHGETLPAHGPLYPAHITVILLDVLLPFLPGYIAEIFDKQHRQDIVLIAGTVNLPTETVAGSP